MNFPVCRFSWWSNDAKFSIFLTNFSFWSESSQFFVGVLLRAIILCPSYRIVPGSPVIMRTTVTFTPFSQIFIFILFIFSVSFSFTLRSAEVTSTTWQSFSFVISTMFELQPKSKISEVFFSFFLLFIAILFVRTNINCLHISKWIAGLYPIVPRTYFLNSIFAAVTYSSVSFLPSF